VFIKNPEGTDIFCIDLLLGLIQNVILVFVQNVVGVFVVDVLHKLRIEVAWIRLFHEFQRLCGLSNIVFFGIGLREILEESD